MAQYRVPVLESYEFQPPVINQLADPPVSPVKGDRYLVIATASGDWTGQEKKIAWYDGSAWKFDSPLEGMLTFDKTVNKFYFYNGTVWGELFTELGLGDMLKSVYDTDDDGRVDVAETLNDQSGNEVTAAQAKDAVDKSHAHVNKVILDAIEEAFTTSLKTAYDEAVSESHIHSNKIVLDAIDVAFTTVLKGQYDTAYSSRAQYDSDLEMIIFNL